MFNLLRYLDRHLSSRGPLTAAIIVAAIITLAPLGSAPSAQQPYLHLNPSIEKLAAGKPMIGGQTSDLSMQNCRAMSRMADFDYMYVDMEHGPFDLQSLAYCAAAMVDKAAVLKKGNAQPNVALYARFPPGGPDASNEWVAKQALDIGLMGIIFNGVDNKEQATRVVSYMRYPQAKTSKYPQPPGVRGFAPGNAVFTWGISAAEYDRHADVWPLNPEGDLLAIPMIETLEGVRNANEIASVPGVGAIFIGAGGDLHKWLGVEQSSAEVETARQVILSACKAHNVPCGITAISKADVDKRLKEGWRMIRTGSGGG